MDLSGSQAGLEPVLHAKKMFGQNFLVQKSAVQAILRETLSVSSTRILEIGPGAGALTEGLLHDGRPLWAMDLDPEAIEHLQQRFKGVEHFHLLKGDAIRDPLPDGPSWTVVGNLPYNAATPILTRFLLEPIPWNKLTFMFQLEVGQKIMGRIGEKSYGPLAVLSQLCCRVSRLMKLGPGAFRPAPKVHSAVLLFDPLSEAPDWETRRLLLKLLHLSFAHRRKTLSNNWSGWLEPTLIQDILAAEGVEPSLRAEAIEPARWLSLLARVRPFLKNP